MKRLKIIGLLLIVITTISYCRNTHSLDKSENSLEYQCPMKCEGEKTYPKQGSCPVCNMDVTPIRQKVLAEVNQDEISETSIFNLTSKWNTEEGETIELKELKGKTLVVVMIYTTCKVACPRLVADMRHIEADIPDNLIGNINFVMVSIDPETDTPKRLKAFAKENLMDDNQWTFLQGSVADVREFANVLAVKYKEISPMDFSHSNIISVFDSHGELVHQQEGLGVDNKQTVNKILELQD